LGAFFGSGSAAHFFCASAHINLRAASLQALEQYSLFVSGTLQKRQTMKQETTGRFQ
jgi:hypothetical protein